MSGPATGAIPLVNLPAAPSPTALLRRLGPGRIALLLVVLACAAAATAAIAAGIRLYVVQSPSMGEAAPVGSLVVGAPPAGQEPRIGDIVTYRAPDSTVTYTHRISSRVAGGYRTRGDINGAADPWVVTRAMIVTRAVAVLPGLGWTVRGLPMVVAGMMLTALASFPMRHPTRRASIRLLGIAASFAAAAAVLRPFTGYQLMNAVAAEGGMRATVVSTALLPIRLTTSGGGHLDLTTGQAGHLLLPADAVGHVVMSSSLHLEPVGWVLLAVVCALPVLWVLVVGLPMPEPADAAAA